MQENIIPAFFYVAFIVKSKLNTKKKVTNINIIYLIISNIFCNIITLVYRLIKN